MTIQARFRTHELAMEAYRLLEAWADVDVPIYDEDGWGYPWVMRVSFDQGGQALVLETIGRFSGVTWSPGGPEDA